MSETRAELVDEAQNDLQDTLSYLLEVSSDEVMVRFVRSLFGTAALLAGMPGMGRSCRFPRHPAVRRFPVKGFRNWLIFYQPTENGIAVLRVLSGRRNWASLFD